MFRVFVLQAKLTTAVLFVYYTKGISAKMQKLCISEKFSTCTDEPSGVEPVPDPCQPIFAATFLWQIPHGNICHLSARFELPNLPLCEPDPTIPNLRFTIEPFTFIL